MSQITEILGIINHHFFELCGFWVSKLYHHVRHQVQAMPGVVTADFGCSEMQMVVNLSAWLLLVHQLWSALLDECHQECLTHIMIVGRHDSFKFA